MKHSLQNFNQICQNILVQKQHGKLHQFRPFGRKKRYLQQDFLQVWQDSCYKKVMTALQGAGISDLKMTLIDTPQARAERDIYIGTKNPGVFLRYKIDHQSEKTLIPTLLYSGIKNNKNNDIFALWRVDIQQLIKSGNDFTLNLQFQVIARVKPKPQQNFQDQKTPEIMNFNQAGFAGSLFIWFDFSKFKQNIRQMLEMQRKQQQNQFNEIHQQTEIDQNQEEISQDDDYFKYEQSNPEQDKVKIGTFDIVIKDSDKIGVGSLVKHFAYGDIGSFTVDKLKNSFDVLLGNKPGKDSTQKPDILRKKIGLFGTERPFVQVISSVTLLDWMYSMQLDKQNNYMNKPQNKSRQITKLIKFPFRKQLLKKPFDPNMTDNMDQSQCWSKGKFYDITTWIRRRITKDYFTKNTDNQQKWITFRFNSWVRSKDGRYYFDYRVAINFSNYYQLSEKIFSEQDKKTNIQIQLQRLNSKQQSQLTMGQRTRIRKYKQQLKMIQNNITKYHQQTLDFKKWLASTMDMALHDTKDRVGNNIIVSKYLMDNKNQVQNKDSIIHNSLRDCAIRDITAYQQIKKWLLEKEWKIDGMPFNQFMQDIVETD